MFCRTNEERTRTKPNIGERKESDHMSENNLTQDIRFNPYRVRRAGLRSTVEAKILRHLAHGPADRKSLARLFDLRTVEHLEQIGLVAYHNGHVAITEAGLETLRRCLGEEHGRGVA